MTRNYQEMTWTPERVARFWAWQSRHPEQYFTYLFGDTIVRHLTPWLNGGKHVLDYGCGTGFLIPHLSERAESVVGTDLSPESVAATNDRHGGIASFSGAFTLEALRQRPERYDIITVIEVVEHLQDRELDALFVDLRDLLAPGGMAIITTPNDENLALSEVYCPATDEVFHRYQHVRSWTAETLEQRVEQSGFAVIRAFTTDLSDAGWRRPVQALLRFAERLRGGQRAAPHLVCICRAADPRP